MSDGNGQGPEAAAASDTERDERFGGKQLTLTDHSRLRRLLRVRHAAERDFARARAALTRAEAALNEAMCDVDEVLTEYLYAYGAERMDQFLPASGRIRSVEDAIKDAMQTAQLAAQRRG